MTNTNTTATTCNNTSIYSIDSVETTPTILKNYM